MGRAKPPVKRLGDRADSDLDFGQPVGVNQGGEEWKDFALRRSYWSAYSSLRLCACMGKSPTSTARRVAPRANRHGLSIESTGS